MRKIMTILSVCFLLLAGLGAPRALCLDEITITVTAEEAPVRLDPSAESPIIETLAAGKTLTASEKKGDWYIVEIPAGDEGYNRMGYIHQSFVKTQAEAAETEEKKVPERRIERPRNVTRRPAARKPPPPSTPKPNRLYINGNFGFGIGFSKIKAGTKYKDGEEVGDINFFPGGGAALRVAIGYRFLNTLMFELGVNYQTSGESLSNGKIYFSRIPLSAEIKYLFPGDSFRIFAGAGPVLFLGANLDWEQDDRDYYVSYNSPFGILAEIGATTEKPGKSLYFFGGAGYMGAFGDYSWEDADFYPAYRIREFSAHGIFLNIGIGYFIN